MEPTKGSMVLLPPPLSSLLSGSPEARLSILVLVGHVVLKVTPASSQEVTRRTVATLCVSCGFVCNTRSILPSHMAEVTLTASFTVTSSPVVANFLALSLALTLSLAPSWAYLHVFLDIPLIIAYFSTLGAHRPLVAEVTGFHMVFECAAAYELLLAVRFVTLLCN